MTDPVKITAAAAIAVGITQIITAWLTSRTKDKIAEVHDVVVKVEQQTNDRLSKLMDEVSNLKSEIAKNTATQTDLKIDKLAQVVKDAGKL